MNRSTRLNLARALALTCSLGVAGWMILRAQSGGPTPAATDSAPGAEDHDGADRASEAPGAGEAAAPGTPLVPFSDPSGRGFLSSSKSLAPPSPQPVSAQPFLSTSKSLEPVFLPTSKSAGAPSGGFFFDDGEDGVFEAKPIPESKPAPKPAPKGDQ